MQTCGKICPTQIRPKINILAYIKMCVEINKHWRSFSRHCKKFITVQLLSKPFQKPFFKFLSCIARSLRELGAQLEAWLSTCLSSVAGWTTTQLWQVSKSQQVYRSIPRYYFNGDTWWGLWIREEMKDHLLSKQDWDMVTDTHVQSNEPFKEWLQNRFRRQWQVNDTQWRWDKTVSIFYSMFLFSNFRVTD